MWGKQKAGRFCVCLPMSYLRFPSAFMLSVEQWAVEVGAVLLDSCVLEGRDGTREEAALCGHILLFAEGQFHKPPTSCCCWACMMGMEVSYITATLSSTQALVHENKHRVEMLCRCRLGWRQWFEIMMQHFVLTEVIHCIVLQVLLKLIVEQCQWLITTLPRVIFYVIKKRTSISLFIQFF